MAALMVPMLIASAGISAIGAIKQGEVASANAQSEANMSRYQADMAEMNAIEVQANASTQQDQQRKQARLAIGNQLAASSEAGAGVNVDLLRDSLFNMESDTNAIRYNASREAAGLTSTAALQRSNASVQNDRASSARTGGVLNAAAALAGAGASYYKSTKKV